MVKKLLLLVGLLGMMLYWASDEERQALEARLARMEAKIDYILSYLGLSINAPTTLKNTGTQATPGFTTLEELVRAGHRLEAIKVYRAQYGVSLQEAEKSVEHLERQLNASLQQESQASTLLIEEVTRLLRLGQRTQAMKLYHERTHLTLSEVKAEIDALEQQLW